MNKLDELFQEKLINHSVTPSSEAWGKIENNLSKKNRAVVWLRWAAVFLLGSLLLSIFLLRQQQSPVTITGTKSFPQPNKEKEISRPISPPTTIAQEQPAIRKGTRKNQALKPVEQTAVQEQKTASEADEGDRVASITESVNIPSPTLTASVNAPASIVLVYTLESVETTTPTNSEATIVASDKSNSPLKKVLNFANNVKNSDSPFDNIRNAKEELFALDFKRKTNSKKH